MPRIAALMAALVAGIRWYYESSITRLVPNDAQGGLWVAYSAVMSTATFIAGCFIAYHLLIALKQRKPVAAALMSLMFIGIVVWTANTLHNLAQRRTALTDAANPKTRPERLHALIGFPTGFGYEIDNRIALNPNTSVEALRILYKKTDQHGTLTCLARNPNTPDDILDGLSKSGDTWILQSLKLNPKYKKRRTNSTSP